MIVDSHCHIFPESFPDRHAQLAARDSTFSSLFPLPGARMATADALVQDMDGAGVDWAVVMGMGWTDLALAREVNDYIIGSIVRYPDRLAGFCSVDPAWGEEATAEVQRCAAAGARGIGELHPDSQGFDITDKCALAPLMECALALGLPVLVHASEPVGHAYPGKGRTTPGKLYRFLENFPENVVICAHWGGGLPFYSLMPEAPGVLRHTYFDSAASPFLYQPGVFPTVAGLVGAEKVLFATDYPLIRHRRLLRQVEESGLASSDQRAILGENAAKLLGLGR